MTEIFLIMCGNLPIDKVGHYLLDFQLYICMDYTGLCMDWRKPMKQKWILTGAVFSLAVALTGCSNIPVLNQLQSSQAQIQTDSMGETKEQAVPTQTTPAQTGAPVIDNSTGEVDEAKAKEIALAHAGVSETEASITKLKPDYEDGRQIYGIEWYANGAKYDYEIEVATGEVIKSGYEVKNSPDIGNGVTTDEETAKQTALARVSGATEKDIYEWKLDYDDNRPEYEGKIIYGNMEYEFTIDANTGEILEWDMDSVYD